MWEINNSLQLLSLARAVALGVIFCLGYDILRAVRKAFSFSVAAVFFQDTFFSLLIAVVTFLFLLSVTNGELRAFVILGICIGFIVCRFTISLLFFNLLKFVILKGKFAFLFLSGIFYSGFDRIERNITIFFKNSVKTVKKLLKKGKGLLYTKKSK